MKGNSGAVKLDWKKLAAIEVNRFEHDLENNSWSVEEIGNIISYSFIDVEFNLVEIDQNFVKLFKLAQIIIRHLLKKLSSLKSLEEQVSTSRSLNVENRKLRKLLEIYKQALCSSSSTISSDLIQCPNCPKAFGDINFLQSHLKRRHPETGLEAKGLLPLTRRINQYTDAIQSSTITTQSIENLKKELQCIRDQLDNTRNELNSEREARMNLEVKIANELEERGFTRPQSSRGQRLEKKCRERVAEPSVHSLEKLSSGLEGKKTVEISIDCGSKGRGQQDLTNLLLSHTQEVRNIGSRLEKMLQKLDNQPSSSEIMTLDSKAIEFSGQNSSHPYDDTSGNKMAMKDREKLLSEISDQLRALGVEEGNSIDYQTFQKTLKEVRAKRKRMRTHEKADQLTNILNDQIRAPDVKKITQRDQLISSQNSRVTPFDEIQTMAKIENDVRSAINSTGKESDSSNVWRPKSVLLLRDETGKLIGREGKKFEKKLRFSETRIEISPEDTEDDGEDEEEEEEEEEEYQNASKQTGQSDGNLATEYNDDESDDDEESNSIEPGEETAEVSSTSKHDDKSKEMSSKSVAQVSSDPVAYSSISDHLKATDLQWFDSDTSDTEEEMDVKQKGETSKKDGLTKVGSLLTDKNEPGELLQNVSVQELTKLIEEQLRQSRSRGKLTTSAVPVAGDTSNESKRKESDGELEGWMQKDMDDIDKYLGHDRL
ncbi:uncharacterized protein LOC141856653 [Brevipalpus obovatus]|uniref:uncharacterized protein LOC141856653 n=1 Tax=Brevipalpus obovatus TaxID=246614 RepID=UPI003D9E4C44